MAYLEIAGKRYATDLVIFDKDGTLLDFKATWINVIRDMIAELERLSDTPVPGLSRRIQEGLGVFIPEREIDGSGPFAMGTADEVNTILAGCLYAEGMPWDRAHERVQNVISAIFCGPVRDRNLRPAPGALELLKRLKERGIPLAVATNDNRAEATHDMEVIGALPSLDLVVGADSVAQTKPAPDMIELICQTLNRKAQTAVMIGDTLMDARMGRNAGVMLTIGISCIVPAEELATCADVVVDSLEQIS